MIYVFLAPGFEEIEALMPVDILRRAGLEVTTVGVGGETVIGSHGIGVQADIPDVLFCDTDPEAIILPGGMPGAKNLNESRIVAQALSVTAKHGGLLCAICAAPFVLAEKGLLKGFRATCFPGFEAQLQAGGALPVSDVRAVPVVTDTHDGRTCITGAGMGVAVPFALSIVAHLCGQEKADRLASSFLAE